MMNSPTPFSTRATTDAAKKARDELATHDEKLNEILDKREIFLAEIHSLDAEYAATLAQRQLNPLANRYPRQDNTLAPVPVAPSAAIATLPSDPEPTAQPDSAPVATVENPPPAQAATTDASTTPIVPATVTSPQPQHNQQMFNGIRTRKYAIGGAFIGLIVAIAIVGLLWTGFNWSASAAGWVADLGWLLFLISVAALIAGFGIGYKRGEDVDKKTPRTHTS